MKPISHVRGDTFELTLKFDDGENPINYDISELKSQIRDNADNLISDLVITKKGEGLYLLAVDDTSHWLANSTLNMDVESRVNGRIKTLCAFQISVTKDVTR